MQELTGEIWVTDFTPEAAQKFRERVVMASEESPEEPIVVYIDSYGGYVDSLAKMIETLDEIPNPIITVCLGKAMSCGAILLSHGDVRYVGRHSRVMIHEISTGTSGDVHDVHADAIESVRLNEYWNGLLAKNCNIQGGYDGFRKIIKSKDGRDLYLDAESAVKFGIADHVGLPEIETVLQCQIKPIPAKKRRPAVKKTVKKPAKPIRK